MDGRIGGDRLKCGWVEVGVMLLVVWVAACGGGMAVWGAEDQQAGDGEQGQSGSEKPFAASLFYPNLEPKQLFEILTETYHVQFEGVDTVTGPLTLISKEQEPVDLAGMLVCSIVFCENRIRWPSRRGR